MKNLNKLLSVIDGEIEGSPVSLHGLKWCGLSQGELAARMGVSRETVKRTLRTKQITRFVCVRGGERVTLLRQNDGKDSLAFRAVLDQRAMAAEFKRYTKQKTVPPKQYGCLFELCKAWPEKHRLAIFRYALRHWQQFMACYKFNLSLKPEASPEWKSRYLRFPNIFVLTDGREVALECYIDHLQDKGQTCD